jgi:cyclopropane-fatty-acyl-phospholipid synthase
MNKIRKMIKRVNPQKEDHILEIGSGIFLGSMTDKRMTGWGACAIEAVRMSGCKVTTITLSHQQKEYVDALVAKLGLSDRITCEIIDYRKIDPTTRTKIGYFDKILSCEMLEAVGHEFLPVYFQRCAELLKPGGLMCFQVITTPNKNYETYRRGCDFIQKHIFPGSLCPSINAVLDAVETADVVRAFKI